ncbi:MAG: non-hydrolyzing UDP-N-acetylglucosamine 2-epimerase [Dehalococcoidia bacterium]
METEQHIMVVAGTRPEVLKLAPVVSALRGLGLAVTVVATGQHSQILEGAFQDIGLQPDVRIDVLRPGQPLPALVARILNGVGALLASRPCRAVVVQGDTASAFGGALAAFLVGVPVFHVEAGLRTNRMDEPFPEEAFRQMLARIATCHFAPTQRAADALVAEGVVPAAIHVTGNTIVDTLQQRSVPAVPHDATLVEVPWDARRVVFLTAHRRENHGPHLHTILNQAVESLDEFPELAFVITSHPNPAVQDALATVRAAVPRFPGRLFVVDPLSYSDVLLALSRCWLVATDSGGLQEEAPSFGKLVLVLRAATERLEGVDAGVARLAGPNLLEGIRAVRSGSFAWPAGVTNPYGDGRAGQRISRTIGAHLGVVPSTLQGA